VEHLAALDYATPDDLLKEVRQHARGKVLCSTIHPQGCTQCTSCHFCRCGEQGWVGSRRGAWGRGGLCSLLRNRHIS
jgi:hypothetical protein